MVRYTWRLKSESSHREDNDSAGDHDLWSRKHRNSGTRWPNWSKTSWEPNWKVKSRQGDKDYLQKSQWMHADGGGGVRRWQNQEIVDEDCLGRSSRSNHHSWHRSWRKPWSAWSSSPNASSDGGGDNSSIQGHAHWTRNQSSLGASPHNMRFHRPWLEATLSGLIMLGQAENEHLLQEWVNRSTPTLSELSAVERCLQELNTVVTTVDQTWRVLPFGSHVSGLSFKGSDLDATCLMTESAKEDPGGQSALHALQWVLQPILVRHPSFRVTQQILQARVPILKLRFEDRLDVDLSCHNVQPLRNSSLIQAYVEISPVVRNFILAVKTWAKAADVCGAKQSKLSTYTFTLMAIYFLQVYPDANLPSVSMQALNNADCIPGQSLTSKLPVWSCKLSLSALLLAFFRFYSEQFAWGGEVVSVRLGKRLRSEEDEFALLPYRASRRIHIEDPFDLKRNLHCVLGAKEERELQMAFHEASNVAEELDTLASWPVPHLANASAPSSDEARGCDLAWESTRAAANTTFSAKGRQEMASVLAPISSSVPSTSLAPNLLANKVIGPEAPAVFGEEDDRWWWFSFLGSCCAYTLYAMFTGQLFRLAVATVALLVVLFFTEPRRRHMINGKSAADTVPAEAWTRAVGRRVRRSEIRALRCRSAQSQ